MPLVIKLLMIVAVPAAVIAGVGWFATGAGEAAAGIGPDAPGLKIGRLRHSAEQKLRWRVILSLRRRHRRDSDEGYQGCADE